MKFEKDRFYHIYNRGINSENIFKERENYIYFLKKYKLRFLNKFDTIAYCLMPNHFHFLIQVKADEIENLSLEFGIFLRSYTQAINKRFKRTGSLFQQHSKAKLVDDEKYFLTLVIYIHQNPIRAKLVDKSEDWEFSSYKDFAGFRKGTLPKKELILSDFDSTKEFHNFSKDLIESVESKYWI